MRVLLRDLAPGQQYAIRFRSNNGEEVSEWSQVQRFTTTNDTIPPSQVTNLSWYDSGAAFIGEWDAVTTQATNPATPLKDFKHYRCNVSDGLKSQDFFVLRERFELTRDMNIATFGSFKDALTLKVYAVDLNYNESVVTQLSANPANPPVPSAATLSNHYGAVLVEWNGRAAGGETMPINLDYLEVHLGTTVNFVADATTFRERLVMNRSSNTQRALLTGLTNGTTYYVRFIAVNVLGKKSAQSAISNSVEKKGLTGLEIANGQIGPAQINFTARDIGGANAYYSNSQPQPGVDGVVTLKSGDIWYDKDNQYTAYRHNGTTWTLDDSIGVVNGTKILAGTVTADAVGTNLIISAKANIGEAIIDSSHIDQLTANKIKAGVLQSTFTVNYGGVVQPAWSFDVNGNAVLNNVSVQGQMSVGSSTNTSANSSFQIKSYNYVAGVAGWAIKGDGSVEFANAVIRGSYRTSTNTATRRIEMGTSGNEGKLLFLSGDGDQQWIRSLTYGANNTEAIEMRGGTESLFMGTNDNTVSMWGHEATIVMRNNFNIFSNPNSSLGGPGQVQRLGINASRLMYWDATARGRMEIGTSNFTIWDATRNRFTIDNAGMVYRDRFDNTRLWFSEPDTHLRTQHADVWFVMRGNDGYTVLKTGAGTEREFFNSGEVRLNYANTDARIHFTPGDILNSPKMVMYAGNNYGILWKCVADNRGVWGELRDWSDSQFYGFRADNVAFESDARVKNNIAPIEESLLEKVRSTKPKRYTKIAKEGNPVQETIGLIAQEAPESMVIGTDSTGLSIDVYQMITTNWGATDELADKHDILEERIAYLESLLKKKDASK